MKMSRQICLWSVLLLVIGCLPTLNPVFTEENLVFDPEILGAWIQPGDKARWDFMERVEKSYRLVYTDKDGNQGRFIARLAEIEGVRFLDLFPENVETGTSAFYKFHLVPIHTVYLVRKTTPKLELVAIDYKWLETYLTEHPNEIQFATFDNRKLITAPTKDVQAFIVKHQAAFNGEFGLQREPAKSK